MREGREESASAEQHAEEVYRRAICTHCEFYKPGESSQCGAFRILRVLIESGEISLEKVEHAAEALEKSSAEEV